MATALESVAALHAQAVEQHNLGHPARARRKLMATQKVIAAGESTPEMAHLAARIGITLALVDFEMSGSAAGLAAAERALELARATDDPALIVPAAGQLGLICMRTGSLARAVETLESITDILDAGEPLDQYRVLLNLGTARMYLGQLKLGRSALVRAVHVAWSAGTVLGEFKALHNLAYLDFLLGDLPGALERMDAALGLGSGASPGIALLDRARVLFEAGLVSDADAALAGAGEIFAADRLSQDLGEVELERARCALITGDIDAARRFAGRARTRFARRGSDRWRQSAELLLLQGDLAAGRPGGRLIGPARRLHDEFVAEGLHSQARTAALIAAEAALATRDARSAEAELAAAGPVKRSDPITYRLHSGYVTARLDAELGNRARAVARLRKGLADLAAYQAGFGSVDLSTAAAVHGRRVAEFDLELAIDSGRPAAIFAAAERGRSVTSRLSPVRPPEDDVTADLLAELRQVVEEQRGVQLDAARFAPLARRRRDLEERIAQRAWSRRGGREVSASISLEQARETVADGAMVLFLVSGATLGALVVDTTGARYRTLAERAVVVEHVRRIRADLDLMAQPRLPAPIAAAVGASFEHSALALDELVLRPLRLDHPRVIPVTTGLLGQVPWGALPSLRGVPVEVVPSATAWVAAREIGRRSGGRRVVTVAGPGLVRADSEAAEVAQAWGLRTSVTGLSATTTALSKAMSSTRVVHVAAHGTHQSENPLFSSIRLADGPLFAHELDQTAGTPEHVVLSACELGLATIRPGDEALGLTSVLLRLGTRSVVAGVARIGDDLAAESMAAYHRRLARGMDSAAALAEVSARASQPLPLVNFGASWSVR